MNIFDQPVPRQSGGPGGLRAEAESYAASLGLTRGTPQWGAAIRDFVLNLPSGPSAAGAQPPMQSGMTRPTDPFSGGGLAAGPLDLARPGAGAPPGQTGAGQPGPAQLIAAAAGMGGMPGNPGMAPMRAGHSPAGPGGGSLFRAPARPGPSLDSPAFAAARPGVDPRPSGSRLSPGSDAAGFAEEEDELELAQLQEGGQSFRRGPGGNARPAAPRAGPPPAPPPANRYPTGDLSRREESGSGGPGTVSTGQSDPGGVSYGTYQLSTDAGTLQSFVNSPEARRWTRELRGQRGGTAEFSRRWRAIATREPEAFDRAQHAFIGRTHYDRAVENVQRGTRVDLYSMPATVREAVWSTSVQHRGAAIPLNNAVRAADRRLRDANDQVDRTSPAYHRALIEEIYDARIAYVRDEVIPNNHNPAERRQLRGLLTGRFPRERNAALRMLDAESRTR